MQAIQLPPVAAPNQGTINMTPFPRVNSGMGSLRRPDCQICSVVSSLPCLIVGGFMASMARDATNMKEAVLFGAGAGGLISLGALALLKPLIQEYSTLRETPAEAPSPAPSPRYALPPLAANNHVVVEMPDRTIAMGLEEEQGQPVNQS